MPRYEMRSAAARRDDGIRTVSRYTWRAGIAGLICSAAIGIAFGNHANAGTPQHSQHGSILVPSKPPAPATGSGQVTSGAS
jgi:hypothetical protein